MKKNLIWLVFVAAILVPAFAVPATVQIVTNNNTAILNFGLNNSKTISCQNFGIETFSIDVDVPVSACGQYLTNISCKVPDNLNCNMPESFQTDIASVNVVTNAARDVIIREFNGTGALRFEACDKAGFYKSQYDTLNNNLNSKDREILILVVLLIIACIFIGVLLLDKMGWMARMSGKKKNFPQFPPQLPPPPEQPSIKEIQQPQITPEILELLKKLRGG